MKIEYRHRKNIFGTKTFLEIFDFEGQQKELENILKHLNENWVVK